MLKKITFPGKKASKKVPVKKALNLMVLESPSARFRKMIPVIVIVAVAIALFCKFAVIDRLIAVGKAESLAAVSENKLAAVEAELVDYDDVLAEYSRYFSDALGSDKAVMPLDCMEALDIVDNYVMVKTNIASISFSGNTATVQITGTQLSEASLLMADLDALPQVSMVTLYTANTERSQTVEGGATILLTITFQEVAE